MAIGAPGAAHAATATQELRYTTADGVSLQVTLSGEAPLGARPTIVEFSPYGNDSQTISPGPDFNVLLVQIRGTGGSDGRFDALGPRTQADVAEVLGWACRQPWSDGTLGLNGFSASAITIYNSLHLPLPCVKAAVLKSGTLELYRDLLVPGGINNIVPGTGVLALIGAPALAQGADRLQRNPVSSLDTIAGLFTAGLSDLQHPLLDSWWRERGFRGDVNHLPILMIDGFFDVESRGAFQGYQALRDDGAHLMVIGAHDGEPAGSGGAAGAMRDWFEHYLRGVDNGIDRRPRARLWLSDGDREDDLAGRFVRYDAGDWPVPGTQWVPLGLGPKTLTLGRPATVTRQSYATIPSIPFNSDTPNTAILGGFGINQLATAVPVLTEMTIAGALGLDYTTKPLASDVLAAGPASLELRLSSTAPETQIWAVISDVSPDGTPHPLTVGRLSTAFPKVDRAKSLRDSRGRIVQPYGRFDRKQPAGVGQERLYRVELWPVGNRFEKGHRIRLHVVGVSAASLPSGVAVNTVRLGGRQGSVLRFPVLPGSDLRAALRGGAARALRSGARG
jgi:putative CocE/NonD family hydrolase